MSKPTLICDLFQWLPPWGEFALRQYWDDHEFVIEVDYEVGEARERDKPILTKVIRFQRPATVIVTRWPPPSTVSAGVPYELDHRGQIFDLGATPLRQELRWQLMNRNTNQPADLTHYSVYFDDMKQTFQVVARGVEVGDGAPPAGR